MHQRQEKIQIVKHNFYKKFMNFSKTKFNIFINACSYNFVIAPKYGFTDIIIDKANRVQVRE